MSTPAAGPQAPVALIDLLDRLLAGGVVIAGDLTLRIADVDLVRVDLRALISSVNENVPSPFAELGPDGAGAAEPVYVEEARLP
ncbi:gas vesicle protein [Streptomyces ochraceiscleroticus]|uniref:gas vesicle protein n=1 Tax=Streptomyces ochraceiscleroticus TaxID=47761 RepID=UPI00068F802A|nr:gas vesicle protein [Streptomyces ochraceiscleroticus]